ncbi:hypothetical protein [Deinococcus misasensis]|uniref:hypothetical protein n=1 Tax=Deinococcus misasensis TaxID=392413 RepID=UPI000A6C1F68|nr:hypothetical protein [Deinococcus misasensis]
MKKSSASKVRFAGFQIGDRDVSVREAREHFLPTLARLVTDPALVSPAVEVA